MKNQFVMICGMAWLALPGGLAGAETQAIWGKSPNKLTIDPEKLERLDYLIAQLKQLLAVRSSAGPGRTRRE